MKFHINTAFLHHSHEDTDDVIIRKGVPFWQVVWENRIARNRILALAGLALFLFLI